MALVFSGDRPARADLARLGAAGGAGMDFAVTGFQGEDGGDEVLALGLTFEIHGLAEDEPVYADRSGPYLGLAEAPAGEAIAIVPGIHIRSDPMMLAVLRVLAGIAARLASAGASALRWEPAGLWVDAPFFTRATDAWREGDAFPAPGLISFERAGEALRTRGLSCLTGQELIMRGDFTPEERASRTVRLLHLLVDGPPIDRERKVRLPGGSYAVLRPSADGRYVEAA